MGGTEEDNTDIEPGETSANEVEANTVQVISAPVNVDIDTNGDGVLSKEEILDGYEKYFGVPIDDAEVDKMF